MHFLWPMLAVPAAYKSAQLRQSVCSLAISKIAPFEFIIIIIIIYLVLFPCYFINTVI